jgi:hypothetical protein
MDSLDRGSANSKALTFTDPYNHGKEAFIHVLNGIRNHDSSGRFRPRSHFENKTKVFGENLPNASLSTINPI